MVTISNHLKPKDQAFSICERSSENAVQSNGRTFSVSVLMRLNASTKNPFSALEIEPLQQNAFPFFLHNSLEVDRNAARTPTR
ncbi:hypothetical protein TNCV_3775581 [Trichonephila clavipes]|nr:hypothetical protein TNCV_3775581 [Trichonephila clavipes]